MNADLPRDLADISASVGDDATARGIVPQPTDEEAVAITAAIHAIWPQPVVIDEEVRIRETTWKFSGRWWNRPLPSRRDRPHR